MINITVKNRGQADSSICFLEWYEHLDAPPGLYQYSYIWTYVPTLAPSATYTWSFSYAYDIIGDFNMYAQIDSANVVAESVEDNNVYGPYGYHVSEGCVGTLSPLGRWCDQGNGTVKDMMTGLIWLKDAGWGSSKPWANCTTWDDAHTKAGMLKSGMAGLSDGSIVGDWRLPTSTELWGIIEGVEYIRTTQMYFFMNVQEWYWSSTTTDLGYANYATANAARMTDGASAGGLGKTINSLGVWPVRGGQ